MFIRHVLRHVEIKRVFFCLEGFSQMVHILPERLLALVRPAFDLAAKDSKSKTLRAGVWLQNRDP